VGVSGVGYLHITAGGKVYTNSFDANIGGAFGTTGSGSVLVDGAGSAWILPNTGASGLYIGDDGPGSLTVSNGGTVSVVSFNGVYIDEQGIVTGNGTLDARVYNYGTVAPGNSIGTLTITNNPYRQAPTGTLEIELASATSYDRLIFPDGGASLEGGTLEVTLIGGYSPSAGHSFDLMDWHQFGFITGTFDTLNLPALPGMLAWDTSQLYTNGVLRVTGPGVPGDYNDDGKVDAADYVVWRKYSGTPTTLPNDPHGGTIGTLQFNTWRANFGNMAGSGGASENEAIPEPATLVLLLVAIPTMRRRQRERLT
jgi:T5SS/PEP-CTERM-associated repeat protein